MDQEKAKHLADLIIQSTSKIVPITPEFEEFFKKQKELDLQSLMGPNTHIAKHYLVDDKICLPQTLTRGYFEGRNIPFTKDDVFFTSFPKSGTTWLQMIALHAIHDCDTRKVKQLNVDIEIPTLEYPECSLKVLKERSSPRYMKSHLPFSMLPPGVCDKSYKIIHITRNPKDLAVSLFHFYTMMKGMAFVGDMNDVLNLFLNDAVMYSPFDQHCLGYWEHRNDENVLFLTYEELHKDTFNQVKRICEFLGKKFNDDQINSLIKSTSFDEMAANPNATHVQWLNNHFANPEKFQFMRKGKIGDWKNHFDKEMEKKFEDWIAKRFEHSDIQFDYE